jgi:hypothetical protein
MTEYWVDHIPAGTSSGVGIHFEFFLFHECGWGSSMLVPLLTSHELSFGLVIPLPVPVVGLGFILIFLFFHEWGWGSSMLDPKFTCEWVRFGLVIPLPVLAVGLGFTLNFIFSWMWVRIQHASPLAHFTMSWVLAWLYSCRYRQWC